MPRQRPRVPENRDDATGGRTIVKIASEGFEMHDLRPAMREGSDRGRIAALAAKLFAAAIDHAPHAHAFEYSEQTVLDATASARRYAVAQARALLAEVDANVAAKVDDTACQHVWHADRTGPDAQWELSCVRCGATKAYEGP